MLLQPSLLARALLRCLCSRAFFFLWARRASACDAFCDTFSGTSDGGGGKLLHSGRDLALLQYLICRGVGEQPQHGAEARALALLKLQVRVHSRRVITGTLGVSNRRVKCTLGRWRCSSCRCVCTRGV